MGTSTATTDAEGPFSRQVVPTDGRDWRYAVEISIPGRPPRTVHLDKPDGDPTLRELL